MIYLTTYALSLFDCMATLWFVVRYGEGIEGNPVGRYLLANPILLLIYKIIIVGSALLFLWKFRGKPLAKISKWTLFITYLLLALYHIILMIYCKIINP